MQISKHIHYIFIITITVSLGVIYCLYSNKVIREELTSFNESKEVQPEKLEELSDDANYPSPVIKLQQLMAQSFSILEPTEGNILNKPFIPYSEEQKFINASEDERLQQLLFEIKKLEKDMSNTIF
ncbi:hypothetical protein [uncultured Psychromonas sp.]|uniref:hypothetical protein n=1 Tax=uncultured Psychromonas sp. TaxID=173974 RepID=UPI00262EDD5A|nr:hypothetical protein [uncultured Psychromonas sp.]